MKQEGKWEKVFNYSIGCLGLVGILATVITLLVALVEPAKVVVWLQTYANLPTPTPLVIVPPSPAPLPTSTPYPTYTPKPTYTLPPTYAPYATSTLPPVPTNTPLPSPTPTLSVALPFSDDFDGGPRAEWQPISGVWRTVDGQYTVTGSEFKWAHSLVGDPTWGDYVIDVDYSTPDSYAIVAVLVRAGGPNGLGLACLTRPGSSTVAWKIWQDGDWETLATKEGGANEGHIRVEVRGSTFTCDFNGLTRLTITDDSTSAGRVGVGIWCRSNANCPVFDNFVVNQLD